MKFSIKDFLVKCDQIRWKLWIWSHLPKEPLMENLIFCVVIAFLVMNLFRTFFSVFIVDFEQVNVNWECS